MMRLPLVSLALVVLASACATVPPRPQDPVLGRGWEVYQDKRCGTCHRVGNDGGTIGPPLTHIGTVAQTRKPAASAEDYIRESIRDPGAYVVPGYPDSMPRGVDRGMTPKDLEDLVQYLLTLQ